MFRTEQPGGNIKAEPAAIEPTTVLKCDDCPYLTTRRDRLEEHRSTHTDGLINPSRLSCPGCCNYFYHKESLEVHLLRDHQVNPDEINKIMCPESQPLQAKSKSRIYIKSVDVLRNPSLVNGIGDCSNNGYQEITQFPPIQCNAIQEPMDTLPSLEPNNHHQQRQKIYLKNVNELQEQQQTNLFQPDFDQFQNIPYQTPMNFPLIQPEYNNEAANVRSGGVETTEIAPPLHPPKNKIYIRNVETLIRPDVQKQSQLETDLPNNNNSTFLHLRSVDDINLMNLEEVQSLPPQRNDIVVLLDDYNEEPQIAEPFYISQPHINPIPEPAVTSSSPADVEELEQAVFNCLEASEGLKMLAENPGFNIPVSSEMANNSYPGVYRTEPVDDSSFYYKNLEENISQLIYSTTNEMQEEPVEILDAEEPPTPSFLLLQIPEEYESTIKQTKLDRTEDISVSESCENLGNVICLPDESDADDCRNGFTPPIIPEPQVPKIFVVSNLTEPQLDPTDCGSNEPAKQSPMKRSRGRPKGGRNYGKNGGDFSFACSEQGCPRRFNQKSNLDYHQRCHDQDSKGIICPECETKEMTSWNNLHTHLWRQHSIDMELYSCGECNFKTPCLSVLRNTHMKIHSEEKAFKCEICNKLYKNQKQLKNHRRRHRIAEEKDSISRKSKDLKCHLCDNPRMEFETTSLLRKHKIQFHRKPRNRCDECGQSFTKVVHLEVHLKEVHGKVKDTVKDDPGGEKLPKIFKCGQCPYETTYRNCARRHKMTHSGEKKYNCQFCDYSCIQSKSFRTHLLRSHPENATELIFNCPQCDYTTINNSQLKFHLAKHEGGTRVTTNPLIEEIIQIPETEIDVEQPTDQVDPLAQTESVMEEILEVVQPDQPQFEIIFEVKDCNAITLD